VTFGVIFVVVLVVILYWLTAGSRGPQPPKGERESTTTTGDLDSPSSLL
jgi:hypothetical protein